MDNPIIRRISSVLTIYRFPILLAISIRLLLSVWMAVLWWFLEPIATQAPKFYAETYQQLIPQSSWFGRAMLDVWLRWDAVHYMNLARIGYAGVGVADYNYPPLYSYLTLWVKNYFGTSEITAGLVISTIAAILAFCFFYRLIWNEYQEEDLARDAVLIFGIFPTSMFLFAPFTEALFFCFLFATLLACQSKKWILAGILVSITSLVRFQAILLSLVILIPILSEYRLKRHLDWHKFAALILSGLGLGGYALWRFSQSAPDLFQGYALHSGSTFLDPFRGYYYAVREAILEPTWLPKFEVLSVTVFGFILIRMVFQKRYQARWDWLVYSLATLLVFLSKNNAYSAYQSANRYVLGLFPVFIAGGVWFKTMHSWQKRVWILSSLICLLLVSTLYVLWIFVG
jgi:hypothetical protein